MLTTRTGNFPIGFRRLRSPWQRDIPGLINWAFQNHFRLIDLGRDADTVARPFLDAGFRIGSADLPEWNPMIFADPAQRKAALQQNTAYIRTCAHLGRGAGPETTSQPTITNFFLVALPQDPNAPRRGNFAHMIDSFNNLTPVLEETDTRIVLEGWPGPGALCCTPETVRATLKACSSRRIGLNFDPSHLLRMGIDPLRFLEEFADHVHHVHGKDTEILSENLYEYGSEQPPTFGKPRGYGSVTWRYAIPGHGHFRWTRALEILASRNYPGAISVELEDENFNGSEAGEKHGLLAAARFLATC
jgi:sugar phosphate isomerase/epimerase